jgi:hypothetical protein
MSLNITYERAKKALSSFIVIRVTDVKIKVIYKLLLKNSYSRCKWLHLPLPFLLIGILYS